MNSRLTIAAALLALSSCSYPLLLKKYVATSPKVPALRDRSIYVAPFIDQRKDEWPGNEEPKPDPPGWEYKEPTSTQMDQWEDERLKLGEGKEVHQLHRVGWKRNGFGIPIRDVFAVNTPEEWLTESTRLELAAQGAIAPVNYQDAEVVVQGVLKYVWLDLYMATWVHIVLDLTTTPRGLPPKTVRLHVSDSKVAWSGSDAESYEIFCSTEQKLQRHVLKEIARALAGTPAAPPPPPPAL